MTERILMGGTDGFRGQAVLEQTGPGLINEETFAGLSAALASYVRDAGDENPVVLGMDTRPSGEALKRAAIAGVQSQGLEAIDLGVMPTPGVQRAARLMGAAATIVITASHNPAEDNGWKGMIGSDKPSKDQVHAISDRYWDLVDNDFKAISAHDNTPERHHEAEEQYVADIIQDIQETFGDKPLAGKLMVVDGAYGAGGELTSAVLNGLGADVYEFACGPDGVINKGCGAAHLEGLEAYLQHNPELTHDPRFLGAVANDGDADRVMGIGLDKFKASPRLVTIDGNHMMYAMSDGQPGIVGTEYTNGGLRQALQHDQVDFLECPNGDVHVTNALREQQRGGKNWTRGGEFTGHLVDTDWLSSGDGVRMAAWMAAWAASHEMTFGDVYRQLPLWYELMYPVTLTDPQAGAAILEASQYQFAQQEVLDEYGDDVRMVVRKSGTEPKIRIWAEGREQHQVEDAVHRVGSVVTQLASNIWT